MMPDPRIPEDAQKIMDELENQKRKIFLACCIAYNRGNDIPYNAICHMLNDTNFSEKELKTMSEREFWAEYFVTGIDNKDFKEIVRKDMLINDNLYKQFKGKKYYIDEIL